MDSVEFKPSPDPYDDLDPSVKRDLDQITDQGCLSEGFTFGGHSFVIRTLNAAEANAAATAMVRFQGTLREVNAYMQATVGLAIFSFDGDPDFHIRVGDLLTHAAKRFEWAGELDDVIINYVFTRYNELDKRRIAARQAVANLSRPDRQDSSPSADSLTEQDTFSVGAPTESPFLVT